MVRARQVEHLFGGGRGVSNMTLQVPSGCIFGLVGPSGSGKTTMVRMILGLLRRQSGSLEVLGVDPQSFSTDERERIGFLPQESALDPELSLQHNLQFMASLYGLPWRGRYVPGQGARDARDRIDDLLELLDLADRRRVRLRDASTGEQRRLAIAAALVHEPDLLILDEPTAGIDPLLREQLWDHFGELRRAGNTLIVTTQYVTEADQCDLVGLVVDGHVLRVATPEDMRREAFGGDLVEVASDQPVPVGELLGVAGVIGVQQRTAQGGLLLLVEDSDQVSAKLRDVLQEGGHRSAAVAPHNPSFDTVFVRLVREHREGRGDGSGPGLVRHRTHPAGAGSDHNGPGGAADPGDAPAQPAPADSDKGGSDAS